MEKGEMGKGVDGFIDRSKVRILLCDSDDKSCEEVFTLLCRCSYQVISVKSPRQVIDALNAEGLEIDLILSEIDLPMSKGLKMLKFIKRDKELRRIPVIMMSSQDEVPIVVKCLKFGAADYLVKPLRTNELLNLWTHMWRRRRTLGLMEKNIVSCSFDLVISDQSDPNTNSTTLFSDDTDERSLMNTNSEACAPSHQEDEAHTLAEVSIAIANTAPSECQPDVPGISDRRTGQMSSFPKKSELKIGESSAFFTYIKTSASRSKVQGACLGNAIPHHTGDVENPMPGGQMGPDPEIQAKDNRETIENHFLVNHSPSTNSIPESFSTEERSCTPPALTDTSHRNLPKESSQDHTLIRNDSQNGIIGGYPHVPYPYHLSGAMNHTMMPHYNHMPHFPNILGAASYPYYPLGMCLQQGQPPAPHPWPLFGNSPSNEAKASKLDRREAALMKFRKKRKERCFDKKIRYVNRKKLAERRPRLRGQFVRKVNGINVDLNGQPASTEDDEEEAEGHRTISSAC